MVGFFEDKELAARKRLLVGQSEIYRETLKLETRNLGLYGLTLRQRWAWFRAANPAIAVIIPFVQSLIARRRRKRMGWFGKALWGWQIYHRFSPILSQFALRWAAYRQTRADGHNAPEPTPDYPRVYGTAKK